VLAQESTSSAVSDDDVKEKIKEKFNETVDKDLDEVEEEIKEEASSKLYAWTGTVTENDGQEIKVETLEGEKKLKADSEATIFTLVDGVKQDLEAEEIEKGQYLIAMGVKEEEDLILGKRIIVLDEKPAVTKRKVVSGLVTEVDVDKDVVAIENNGETEALGFNEKTALKIVGIKSPIVEDIQIDDFLSAIVTVGDDDEIDEVKVVMVVPGKTSPQAEENQVTAEDLEEVETTPSAESTDSAE
jgi:hypothetical protein